MSDTRVEFTNQLKAKRICRFCLTQDEPLTNIYSNENRKNLRAPLPLQVMACVSIEVFTNDDMPSTICENCRLIMDYCYRFKQICRKADTALKQYPLTGVWPDKLDHPKYPIRELHALPVAPSHEPPANTLKRKLSPPVVTGSSPSKKRIAQTNMKIDLDSLELNLDDVEVEFIETIDPPLTSPEIEDVKFTPPKILNKSTAKILNKQASSASKREPIIRQPILRTIEDGTVEIVSEIEESMEEPLAEGNDPLKNAAPVLTNVYPCEYCERSFPLRQLLDIHRLNHVRDRNFTCDVCQKGFFSKYDLNKHSLIHTGERPFKCIVCEKSFSRSTLLRRHEKIHTDHPKFLCAYCERPFLCKEEWEKHTLNHQKKRPFECSVCNKTFAFKQGLERHEVVHATIHPYKCDHCEESFPSQGKLARHLTAHAGSRPYPCRICSKSYLLSHHLTRHMRSHKEATLDSYKCHECDETFGDRDKLMLHWGVHATENLKCPLCKEHFETADDVTEHIKQHNEGDQYACEFCDSIFLTEHQLQEHSDTQHAEENMLYDDDNRKRENQNVEVLESFTIVGDVLVPNAGTNDNRYLLSDYSSDGTSEYTILDKSGDNIIIKQESDAEPSSVQRKPLRRYGKAVPKAAAEKQQTTAKPTKIPDDTPVNTVKAKSAPSLQSKSPTRQSERKTSNAEPTKQSPKTRSTAATTSSPASVKKPTQVTITQMMAKKVAASTSQETPAKKPITTRSLKSPTQAPALTPTPVKAVAPPKKSPATGKLPTVASARSTENLTKVIRKSADAAKSPTTMLNIGDKMVEVKRVRMTKAQIEEMKKQGKIEMRDGRMCMLSPK